MALIKTKKKKFKINLNPEIGGVSQKDILVFTKHITVILKSGLTLMEGLEIYLEKSKGRLKSIISDMIDGLNNGKHLYQTLDRHKKYFSPVYVNLIKSGELSGTLETNLSYLADQLEKSYKIRKKIKAAMLYPTIIFISVGILGLAVGVWVLPKIVPLFKSLDTNLPTSTKILITIAEAFEKHGINILFGTVAICTFFAWFIKRDFVKPITHRLILKIPVVKNLSMNINLALFCRTMSILLGSSMTVTESLKITGNTVENRLYRDKIHRIRNAVEKGDDISSAAGYKSNIFPPEMVHLVAVGEHTGNLDTNLEYLADFYEAEVDSATKNLSNILEPILIVLIGFTVGGMAIAILGPIYEITGGLRN